MNQTTYNTLQTERITNTARNTAIDAQIVADPLESIRYWVDLGPLVDQGGYTENAMIVNGQSIGARVNCNTAVNGDAQFNNGRFELSSPVGECPPPVTVQVDGESEASFAWEAIA